MAKPDPKVESTYREIRIKSTLQDAKKPEIQILADVRDCGYDEEAIFAIKLALEEAMTNAVKHGNCNNPDKNITVRFAVDNYMVAICVRDEGCGFTPEEIPDCTDEDRISLPNGRGIMLIRAYMDDVEYRSDGREIFMTKRNKKKRPHEPS